MAEGTNMDPGGAGGPHDWAARLFGGDPATEWPVAEPPALGERNGPMAWLEYGAARGATGFLNVMPRRLRDLGVGALARFAMLVTPGRTRMARDFVSTALPHLSPAETERQILQSWKHLFRLSLMSEQVGKRLLGRPLGEHFDFEICDEARDLCGSGRACLFVTSHLGHWEIAPGIISAMGFRALYVVGKPPKNRPLSRRLQAMRELIGVRVLPRRGAMKTIPAVLRGGGHVAMVLDQRARLKPVIAPFFGRPARCDRSAGVLIRRLGVPIVIGGCVETDEPWRFRFLMTRVIHPEDIEGARPEEVVELLNGELEKLILRFPDQYFWLHDRYRDAPASFDETEPREGPPPASRATSPDSVSNQPAHGA